MHKIYSILAALILLSQLTTAQSHNPGTSPKSKEIFLANEAEHILAWQDNFNQKQNSIWAVYHDEHQKLVDREMKVYRRQATLTVPTTGTAYDVKYYRLELRINPDTSAGKYINGKVTTYFTTTIPNFSVAEFDFGSPLTCDSVYYHGVKLGVAKIERPLDLLKITLPVIPAVGTLDSVAVYYNGVPAYVPDFGGGTGYVNTVHNGSQKYVYTLSEPYSSYTWWPCKSFVVNDKADSMDLIVSTPAGFKTAGNGILVSEITQGANVITYWKERYPIAAYQVCTAVANYDVYPATPTTVNIGGSVMPFYNYIFPETNTPSAQVALDNTKQMLLTFSNKLGDYPFKNEKYGHYTFGFGGGMEHNTFSGMSADTYNNTGNWWIVAHELGHQWFGASVTCGSWKDIWINESFATFAEAICAEYAPGVSGGQTGVSWRGYHKSQAINPGYQSQAVAVSDTSSITSIFTPSVYVYERGAMVIYMLRTLLGDAKFFQAIQNLQADPLLRYGNAVTTDIKRHLEAVSGLNLTTFFNQWIYNTGFAEYNGAEWNNQGTQIVLKLPQLTRFSSLSHFDMPLAIRIQGSAGGDTTVIAYDDNGVISYNNNGVLTSTGSNIIQYNLSFVPAVITFDAFNQVLANGSFTKNAGLGVLATNAVNVTGKKVGAQVNLLWTIDKAASYASFEIERSNDIVSFKTIGKISAQNAISDYDYYFTDYSSFTSAAYYRLKVIKNDGTFFYTKTLAIAASVSARYTISPNPATDYVNINVYAQKSDVLQIRLLDNNGKAILIQKQAVAKGKNVIKLARLNHYPEGVYTIQMIINGNMVTEKLVLAKSR